jgi:hypothetical protein
MNFLGHGNYCKLKQAVTALYFHVSQNQPNPKGKIPMTELAEVQAIQAAYDALKAKVTAQTQQIAALQAQVAAGTPATADQIAALAAVDTLAAEVAADTAPVAAPVASA